jgi:hypothetical protein
VPRKRRLACESQQQAVEEELKRLASESTQNAEKRKEKFLYENVRSHKHNWVKAGASTETLKWISPGVRVPWLKDPPPSFHQGASLTDRTPQQDAWWQVEKERLVECGAWERGGKSDYVTKAFLVPKPGGWRLVVDLRHLNSFVKGASTKFETLKSLRRMAKRNDWMFSFDLKDG